MRVFFGAKKIKGLKSPLVALGVFDGLHLGHLNILNGLVQKARRDKAKSLVLTFWPHPQGQESLYSLEHRLRLFGSLGIDVCLVMKFTKKFSQISAQSFIEDILVKKIGASYVFVGRNFRFGKHASSGINDLKRFARRYNFKLKIFEVIKIKGRPVSSTYIRNLIKKGNLATASKLLGRKVTVLGTVVRGSSLARRLGFPTANIDPHHEVIPPSGVYAVDVVYRNKKLKGICNIGIKPTFSFHKDLKFLSKRNQHIELHIFNFRKNIYGEYLQIQFIKKIRPEKKFTHPLALAAQIKKDIKSLL